MFVGGIIGILLSLTIYGEALKMSVNNQEIMINKDNRKSEIKEIFMEDYTVVIISNKSQELLSENKDVKRIELPSYLSLWWSD